MATRRSRRREVAPYGGFVKQYQMRSIPTAHRLPHPLDMVVTAVRKSNNDVGAASSEWSGVSTCPCQGYLKGVAGLEQVAARAPPDGTPILVARRLRACTLARRIRRGVADLDGQGDVAAGIVVIARASIPTA